MPVMDIAQDALLVDNHLSGLPAHSKEIDLLAIKLQYLMTFIRNTDKRQAVFLPVFLKAFSIFRSYRNDNRIPFSILLVFPTQPRQVPSAKRSDKTTV